jgi:hypothetical protein
LISGLLFLFQDKLSHWLKSTQSSCFYPSFPRFLVHMRCNWF